MKFKVFNYSVAQQFSDIKRKYSQFSVELKQGALTVKGGLSPTPRSIEYNFIINYRPKTKISVRITNPELKRNFNGEIIPHLYSQKRQVLCLYYPAYGEFNSTKLISKTIIPWISLWLYHYENWHITGVWEGGGIHFPAKNRKNIS